MTHATRETQALAARIRDLVVREGAATPQVLEMIEGAVRLHPDCAALWCLRGDVFQLVEDEPSPEQVIASYMEASRLSPEDPEPLESLGHFFDGVMDDPAEAEGFFRRALDLGAGESARQGLAEALEQLEAERD